MPSIIDGILGNNYIANGLPGPVFQAAIENRGVFENVNNKAGAMYMCTGETLKVSVGGFTFDVPKVIAVEGPKNKNGGNYYIGITFEDADNDNKIVSSAQLVHV